MRNAGLDEHISWNEDCQGNINKLRHADDITLMAESEEELKSLLMKLKRAKWKGWLKTQHSKNWVWHPVPSLHGKQMEKTVETAADFIFLGSKISADDDYSHEIKRRLLLGRQAMTNLDNILKSRSITLLTKVHIVKAMVFPVIMYGCESQKAFT